MAEFVSEIVENFVGKRKNAGFQHFLFFPQCFQKPFFSLCYKSGLCGKESANLFLLKTVVKSKNEQYFSLFLTTFFYSMKDKFHVSEFNYLSVNTFSSDRAKVLLFDIEDNQLVIFYMKNIL